MPTMEETIRGLSPEALNLFKQQLPERLKAMGELERNTLLEQLQTMPEFGMMPTEPQEPPAWQKPLQWLGKVFEPIEEHWAKPIAAGMLAPMYREEPLWEQLLRGAGPLAWATMYQPETERREEYEEWEAPKYVKGAAEFLPWLALPTAGGTAAYLRTTGRAGQIAAKALTPAVKAEEAIAYPIRKLTDVFKAARGARIETKALRHEELAKRVGKAAGVLAKGEGEVAFRESLVALKGKLPIAEFAPEKVLNADDITQLYNHIKDVPTDLMGNKMTYFKRLNTYKGLSKLLTGDIPQPKELELLENIFGKEMAAEFIAARKLGVTKFDKVMDAANLPRAVLASFDLSGLLRQGGILVARHPIEGSKTIAPMLKAFGSEKAAVITDQLIKSRPNFEFGEQMGLYIAPLIEKAGAKLFQREEMFMSRLAHAVPFVRRSERAYVTVLNDLRSRVWEQTVESWKKLGATERDYRALAKFINDATGRGSFHPLTGRSTGPLFNATFFSPRLILSRVMLPRHLWSQSPLLRKEAQRTLATFLGVGVSLLALAKLAGAELEADPRSADFGKIKVETTRLDIWTGYLQYARFITQLTSAQRKTQAGNISELNRAEVVQRFAQTKFAPAVALLYDMLQGESYMGEEMALDTKSIGRQAFNRLIPLFIQDLADAVNQEGLTGAFVAAPGALGIGVITYVDEVDKIRGKLAEPYGVLWEELTRETQMGIEQSSPELQEALKERNEKMKGITYGDYLDEGQRIEQIYQDTIMQKVAKFRATGDGSAFRQDVGAIVYARRMMYGNREKAEKFQEIVERYNEPLTAEDIAKMPPEDYARKIFYDIMYADDMFDEYGDYRWEEVDRRRAWFVQNFGQKNLDYVERVMGLKWDEPPELKALREARKTLRPYWDIETRIWSNYPAQLKVISDQIKILERTNPFEAKQMLFQYPQILMARKIIALYKKQLKMQSPQIANALDMYYRY